MTFLWGTATAAHQVEGGNDGNDVWDAEHAVPSVFVEPSGQACDSFHRYAQDIAIVADLGLDAYRFSLEWSRIEPSEGEFSPAAINHYRRMVECCRDAGVQPVVTLHHFTSPRWLAQSGGWARPDLVDRFTRYCESVLPVLEDVDLVCTINEPNIVVEWNHLLSRTTEDRPLLLARVRAAHEAAVEVVRGAGAQAGWTVAMRSWESLPGGEQQVAQLRRAAEDVYLEELSGDFIGVQAYTGEIVGPDGIVPLGADEPRTLTGWRVWPHVLGAAVTRAATLTDLPVIVTENGIATDDDDQRIAYLDEALRGLAAAMAAGVDVRGYFAWSLLDNFEWILGYRPTFGLVAVDRTTFVRTPKPSALWYADHCSRARTAVSSARRPEGPS